MRTVLRSNLLSRPQDFDAELGDVTVPAPLTAAA